MGIIPVLFPQGIKPQTLKIQPGDQIEIEAFAENIQPRAVITVRIHRVNGQIEELLSPIAVETQLEVDLLRDGGVIPAILKKTIRESKELKLVE
jgi:aconitate hydratase